MKQRLKALNVTPREKWSAADFEFYNFGTDPKVSKLLKQFDS